MHRRGLTLPELLIYLLLLGVAVQSVVGPARRQTDALLLAGAREEVVALFHRARMEARQHGESRILFVDGADPVLVLSGDRSPLRVPLSSRGIDARVLGAREAVEFAYGPLGVAQFAPATLTLRRGRAELVLIVSSYGRVRR